MNGSAAPSRDPRPGSAYSDSSRPARPRRRPRRWVTVLCGVWAGFVLLLGLAWPLDGASFVVDLIANLSAQWLVLGLLVMLVCVGLRRWRCAVLALAACALHAAPMTLDRAAWLPQSIPGAARLTPGPRLPSPDAVRVLHFNARGQSPKEWVEQLIDRADADVISLVSPQARQQFHVIYGDGYEDRFPGKLTRVWQPSDDGEDTRISPAVLLSRWPIRRFDTTSIGAMAEHLIVGVIERPTGPIGVICTHPRSPRTNRRWIEGNLTVEAVITVSNEMQDQGLPVIVVADLNSTAGGWRTRTLSDLGRLRRCKPVLASVGTYPEGVPLGRNPRTAPSMPVGWPLTIAIDDVWASRGVHVKGWSALPTAQSEHRPILVDLIVEGRARK